LRLLLISGTIAPCRRIRNAVEGDGEVEIATVDPAVTFHLTPVSA